MKITEARLRRIIRSELLREARDESETDDTHATKRKIFVLVGPPGVGKSTWIAKNFRSIHPYIISRDDVAESVAARYDWTYDDMFQAPPKDAQPGDRHEQFGTVIPSPPFMTWQPLSYSLVLAANKEVQEEFSARVGGAADSGRDIVVDMTNMNARARQSALAAIKGREAQFETVAVVFPFQGAEDDIVRVVGIRAEKAKAAGRSKSVPPAAVTRMMQAYEPISPAEGFDTVIEFDNRAALKALAAS